MAASHDWRADISSARCSASTAVAPGACAGRSAAAAREAARTAIANRTGVLVLIAPSSCALSRCCPRRARWIRLLRPDELLEAGIGHDRAEVGIGPDTREVAEARLLRPAQELERGVRLAVCGEELGEVVALGRGVDARGGNAGALAVEEDGGVEPEGLLEGLEGLLHPAEGQVGVAQVLPRGGEAGRGLDGLLVGAHGRLEAPAGLLEGADVVPDLGVAGVELERAVVLAAGLGLVPEVLVADPELVVDGRVVRRHLEGLAELLGRGGVPAARDVGGGPAHGLLTLEGAPDARAHGFL